MKRPRLEKYDPHLAEKLKDTEFRKQYELERVKVALAQKLAELRQAQHLNQTELAQKLHVSQQFISQIETAEEKNLTLDTLLRIANTLGRDVKISFPKHSRNNCSALIIG